MLPALVGLVLVAICAAYVARNVRVSTQVTHFLAATEDRRLGALSAALPSSALARTVVLTVDAATLETAHAAADEIAAALAADPEVAWVRRGADEAAGPALLDLYEPVRFAMARDDPAKTAELASPDGLDRALVRLRRALAGPLAPLVKRLAPADPWLLTYDRLRALERARSEGPNLDEGRFVTADGRAAVVLAATKHAPFDGAHTRPFLDRLDGIVAEVTGRHGPSVRVEQSSIHRIARWSEDTIRADVQRISIASTVGVLAILGVFARSLRLVALAFLPLAAGIAAGAAAATALFGTIHGLTLAFGATLIGVAIDYPSHLYAHLRGGEGPVRRAAAVREVFTGIGLGAATTVAGFAGLAAASFPAVREMGVFASAGVAAAALATRWIVVPFLPATLAAVPATRRAARLGARVLAGAARRRGVGLGLLAAAGLLCATGLPRVRFEDDARALQRLEPTMLEEDERVRARVMRADASRFVVAFGDDLEAALRANDEAAVRLAPLVEAGRVRVRSLHDFLWSEALQRANLAVFDDPAVADRLQAALARHGFAPAAFARAADDLRAPQKPLLTWQALADSPLAGAAGSFRVDLPGQVALLSFLQRVDDPAALGAALADLDDVVYFDQRAFLARAYGRYRRRIETMVLVGLAAVALLVLVRYRNLRTAAAAFVPALLAAGGALSILAWSGKPLTMLHLVSCLLVLSMGVDYGVFLAESRGREATGRTLVGIAVACLSTVASFGLLGLSQQPALAAIGRTTGLGVLLAFVLAPITLALLAEDP